jgi:hypothetical protein
MISLDDAATYLLSHGLIDRAWIIDGELTVRCAARRNRNLRVEGPGGAGYLVKQPDGDGGRATLGVEADFYRLCQDGCAAEAISRIVPRLSHYDPDRSLLALRLVAEATSLRAIIDDPERRRGVPAAARAFGQALGAAHAVLGRSDVLGDPRLSAMGSGVPWALAFHRPGPEDLSNLGAANLEVIRILQKQPGVGVRLDGLAEGWRVETPIHGDIKLDNVIAWESPDASGWQVRIVDWEMARLGDPAWDLAGALQGFVGSWIDSMPLDPGLALEHRLDEAAWPLGAMQESIRSMWEGYRSAAGADPRASEERLDRAVELSAPRMIQAAAEISWDEPALTARPAMRLQVAINVLASPGVARTQLFGIPAPLPSP